MAKSLERKKELLQSTNVIALDGMNALDKAKAEEEEEKEQEFK